jgi:hypothetical protein
LCPSYAQKDDRETLINAIKRSASRGQASKKAIRFRKSQDIGKQVNIIGFRTVEKPGRYKVPFDKVKGILLEISFNDEWAQNIDVKFAELIPRIFTTAYARQ